MRSKLRWRKFYDDDWNHDISGCCAAARGVMAEIMKFAAENQDGYGVAAQKFSSETWARKCGCRNKEEFEAMLEELSGSGAVEISDGSIRVPSMIQQRAEEESAAEKARSAVSHRWAGTRDTKGKPESRIRDVYGAYTASKAKPYLELDLELEGDKNTTSGVPELVDANLHFDPPEVNPTLKPTLNPTESAEPKKERPRNELWDALEAVFGKVVTKPERDLRGKVVKELKAAGAAPSDVAIRAERLAAEWGADKLTETSLLKHWSRFISERPKSGNGNGNATAKAFGWRIGMTPWWDDPDGVLRIHDLDTGVSIHDAAGNPAPPGMRSDPPL
jgi:hypothetical protein